MGKSSSQVIGFRYLVAYLHGICGHPIDAFLEFRAAGKTAWSGRLTDTGTINIHRPGLFGGDKDQGGIDSDVDIQFGKPGQAPNAYMLEAFGSQVAGMEGVTTLVFKGGEFGAMNPYPQKPSYKGEAIKMGWDGDPGDGSACWYPEKAVVPLANSTILPVDADGWEYQILANESDPAHTNLSVPTSGWLEDGQGPFAGGTASGNTDWPVQTIIWIRRQLSNVGGYMLTVSGDNGFVVLINGSVAGIANPQNDNSPGDKSVSVTMPPGTFELAIKGYDEPHAPGDPAGGVILRAVISAAGLNAMNPAHVLYELRTAADRGQEPVSSMADASWRTAADWFFNNSVGLCTYYDPDEESVDDAIARIEKVCACAVNRDPTDGLWYLDIANGVYDLDSLPILTDDDILDWNDSPKPLDDLVNSIAVEYFDPQQWINVTTRPVTALALISANGLNHQTNEYHELPTADLANRIALRDLAAAITPASVFSDVVTTRKPYSWRRNTYFRIQAPKKGIADLVVLLAEKSDGTLKSGAMTISAGQDIYNLAAASYMESDPGVDTRPSQIPTAIMQQAVFEAPYIEIVTRLSRADLAALPDDVGYLMAVAKNPNAALNYNLMLSTDGGSTYADRGADTWTPNCLIVEGDDLADGIQTDFTFTNADLLTQVKIGQAAMWDNEWVRVDALDTTANTITLGRGCADTLPEEHAASSRIWFYQAGVGADTTEYTDGEAIDVELLTNSGGNQLDPSLATPMALTFNERQARPYVPANLTINGKPWYAPDDPVAVNVTLAWANRDRVGQADQLLDYSQASTGPETDATCTLRIYDASDTLIDTVDGITGTTTTYTPPADGTYRLEFESSRDGIASWQKYSVSFDFVSALQYLISEDGDQFVAEDGVTKFIAE